jgi:hypothetical protein
MAGTIEVIDMAVNSRELALHRSWRSEPHSPTDREVDIWFNGNWVPAYFSDLQKGDFFIVDSPALKKGECFSAQSNVRIELYRGQYTYVIPRGALVAQLAEKVINPLHSRPPPLEYQLLKLK